MGGTSTLAVFHMVPRDRRGMLGEPRRSAAEKRSPRNFFYHFTGDLDALDARTRSASFCSNVPCSAVSDQTRTDYRHGSSGTLKRQPSSKTIPLTPRAASPPPRRSRPYPRHVRCTTGRGPSSSSSIARPSTVQASTGGASICAGGSRGTVPCQAASTIARCGLADAGRAALTHPTAPAPTPLSSWAEACSTSHLRGLGCLLLGPPNPPPCPR